MNSVRRARGAGRSALPPPAPARPVTPTATADQAKQKQKHDRADESVDNERADQADDQIADEAKPTASHHAAGEPAGDNSDDDDDQKALIGKVHNRPRLKRRKNQCTAVEKVPRCFCFLRDLRREHRQQLRRLSSPTDDLTIDRMGPDYRAYQSGTEVAMTPPGQDAAVIAAGHVRVAA